MLQQKTGPPRLGHPTTELARLNSCQSPGVVQISVPLPTPTWKATYRERESERERIFRLVLLGFVCRICHRESAPVDGFCWLEKSTLPSRVHPWNFPKLLSVTKSCNYWVPRKDHVHTVVVYQTQGPRKTICLVQHLSQKRGLVSQPNIWY